jgi:hypothetical protein
MRDRSDNGLCARVNVNMLDDDVSIPPEVPKPRLPQLGVARGMRDRDVAEPVLNRASVDCVIGELVAAAVPRHVEVHRQREAGALADDLDEEFPAQS